MKKLRISFIPIFSWLLLTHANVLYAAQPYPDAPLMPGTKVVAGDLSKDEFFIVADNDVMKVKQPIIETIEKPAAPKSQPVIQIAESKPRIHKTAPAIQLAVNNTPVQKPLLPIQIAMHKPVKSQAGVDFAPINTALRLNAILKKGVNHKAHELVNVALNKVPAYKLPIISDAPRSKTVIEKAELINVALNKALLHKAAMQTKIALNQSKQVINKKDITKIKAALYKATSKPFKPTYKQYIKPTQTALKKPSKHKRHVAKKHEIFTAHIALYEPNAVKYVKQVKHNRQVVAVLKTHKQRLASHKRATARMALR